MARGQDAPPVKGGEIDPYVQQSMLIGKQGAENRIVEAMRESAQAGQQRQAAMTGAVQQGVQLGAEAYQAAAQRAQDDKRAAEAERERREQQKFADTQRRAHEKFTAEQNRMMRQHDLDVLQKNLDDAGKTRAESRAMKKVELYLAARDARQRNNILASIVRGGQMRQLGDEKLLTASQQMADEYERDKKIYDKITERVSDKAEVDFKNLPIEEKKVAVPTRGVYEFGMHYEPAISGKEYQGPVKVLQNTLSSNGTKISVEDLSPSSIDNVRKGIADKKITIADIRNASAVFEGILPSVEKRVNESTGQEKILWRTAYERFTNMQESLESLRYDNSTKISGSKNQTVGSEVRRALGTKYPELSQSAQMAEMRSMYRGNDQMFLNEVSKGLEPVELIPLDMFADDALAIKYAEEQNEIYRKTYPERFGEETVAWGAE